MHSILHKVRMRYVALTLLFSIYLWEYGATYKHDPWVSQNTFSIEGITIPLFQFGEKSYYIGESKLTYFEAGQFCKNINMELVTVHSFEEFETLWNYIRRTTNLRKLWTSGSILLNGHDWIWMSTMELVKFTKWKPGEPNNRLAEKCLEFLSDDNITFLFNDRDCSAKVAFICERDRRRLVSDKTSNSNSFKHYPNNPTLPITIIDNVKYRVSKYATTQEEASKDCKKYEMELVSIMDKKKSDDVINLIRKNLNPDIENFFWTSAKKQASGKWIWGEHHPIIYTNWASSEPNNLGLSELCLHLFANGQWSDIKCDDKLLFICEGPNVDSFDQCESQPAPIINVYVNNNQKTHPTNTADTSNEVACSCTGDGDASRLIQPRFGHNNGN
ncbi:macrophage mannose receptor 1-like [Anoplophora glabripennis]|uniref:macrophage mannose receptor 1-like n=1 Tax=Anoplophora glabripennis TaxID=217634 RepID=UPI0008737AC0|nr:macrophage mannose receptor 1-like [Anoplophora glabripennis]